MTRDRLVGAAALFLALLFVLVVWTVAGEAAQSNNFKVRCGFSHQLDDDPIVFPGEPGASHAHDFYGPSWLDAHSTVYHFAANILLGGTHSCSTALQAKGHDGDHSGYWHPALYRGGQHLEPDAILAYYSRQTDGPVQAYPFGLRVVATGHLWDLVELPQGPSLKLRVFFPDCWNGVDGDSPDHQSHMAFSQDGDCPESHPVAVPRLMQVVTWGDVDSLDGLTLSSGALDTAHADFWNAWNPADLDELVAGCLNLPDGGCKEGRT